MKRVRRPLVPMAALWLAATASAQQIKPGLWENTSQMGGAMGAPMAQMQQQMASMPPAQRKQMEAMLAQQGIRMDAQGVTSKVCITKEMAERVMQAEGTQTFAGEGLKVGGEGMKGFYDNILPNVNVAFDATDDVVLRFSAAQVMARPNYGDMSSYLWLGDQTLTGGGGNPELDPYRSTNWDFSAEWYFAENSILAGTLFYSLF